METGEKRSWGEFSTGRAAGYWIFFFLLTTTQPIRLLLLGKLFSFFLFLFHPCGASRRDTSPQKVSGEGRGRREEGSR